MSQSLIFSPLFLFQFPALEIRLGTQQLSKFLADWGAGSPPSPASRENPKPSFQPVFH